MDQPGRGAISGRLGVAIVLAVAALALTMAGAGLPGSGSSGTMAGDLSPSVIDGMRDSLDAVLFRHAIVRSAQKAWRVQGGDGRVFRFALSAEVPADFPTLEVNHELSLALAPFHAAVFATERTKARTVTMHVVRDGVTIWSVSFIRQPA